MARMSAKRTARARGPSLDGRRADARRYDDLLAIIGGVWNHPEGPVAGVRAINAAIKAAQG